MSKASKRRQTRRANFLGKLAVDDPFHFSAEWTKRLESWSREARRNVRLLKVVTGNPTKSTSQIVAYADEQLGSCGIQAYELESQNTREVLLNESAVTLSSAVDGRMYRVVSSRETCDRLEMYRVRRQRKGKT